MNADAVVSTTPLVVIGLYLLGLIVLGLVSRQFFRGTSADYFVVSRSIGPVFLLMSIFGTTMTGFALVGSTGKSFTSGIGVYGLMASWSGLVHSAVFFVVGIRLWAIGKRNGYVTQCAYFRDRFESPFLGYALFAVLVLLVIPYLLVGIISAGKFLQATTAGMFPETFVKTLPNGNPHPLNGGIPPWLGAMLICSIVLFYVFFGGLRGAVWANALQTTVFMITGFIAFYMISSRLGGLSEASKMVADNEWASQRLAREGLIGKLQFFSYCFIPLSVGMFPHLFQHWLTAKSARSFKLTVVAHPIFIMLVWIPCILIGVWGAAYLGDRVTPNAVLGLMVKQLVHSPVLTGLVGAGVLAAIMSSLDSQFMCLGTMFTNDVVVRLFGQKRFSDTQKVVLARGFILVIVAVSYLLSIALVNTAGVFDLGVWCFSGFAALFPLVVASLYWRRVTKAGAIAALLATGAVWAVLFYQDIIAAKPEGAEEGEMLIGGMMPVTLMFAVSAVTLVVVSLATRPPAQRTVDRFFMTPSAG